MVQSPRVGTPDYYYHYAANFHQAYFQGVTVKLAQLLRLLFGLFFVLLLAEELFVGPTDTISSVAYLSLWGILAAFITMLFQYKSCNYELRKNGTVNGATIYAHGVFYKKLALQSLELAVAINAVIFWGYVGFILPHRDLNVDKALFYILLYYISLFYILFYSSPETPPPTPRRVAGFGGRGRGRGRGGGGGGL